MAQSTSLVSTAPIEGTGDILTAEDSLAETGSAAGAASIPSPDSQESHLRGIAGDIQQCAVTSDVAQERHQAKLRQLLQYDAEIVSLLKEMKSNLHVLVTQHMQETQSFQSQVLETLQIIGAGISGNSHLFPSVRDPPAQRNQRSEGDD